MNVDETLSDLGVKVNLGALTLDKVVHVLLLILVGVVVIRVVLKLLDRVLARSKSLKSLSRYIHSVAKIAMTVILVLMVAEDMGIHTTSLVAMLSVAGLAVSLALQNTLSNVAGGIMLLVTTPFQVGTMWRPTASPVPSTPSTYPTPPSSPSTEKRFLCPTASCPGPRSSTIPSWAAAGWT